MLPDFGLQQDLAFIKKRERLHIISSCVAHNE